MMRLFTFLLFFVTSACFAQKKHPEKDLPLPPQKIIALLPANFILITTAQEKKSLGPEKIKDIELKMSFIIQSEMYRWLQKNAENKKMNLRFRDIRFTNDMLFSGGLSFENFLKLSTDSMLTILQTDAVLYCNTESSKIISGGDEGIGTILGFAGGVKGALLDFATPGATRMQIGISEKGNQQPVWTYELSGIGTKNMGTDKALKRLLYNAFTDFTYNTK